MRILLTLALVAASIAATPASAAYPTDGWTLPMKHRGTAATLPDSFPCCFARICIGASRRSPGARWHEETGSPESDEQGTRN